MTHSRFFNPAHIERVTLSEYDAMEFRRKATGIVVMYENENGETLLDSIALKGSASIYHMDLWQGYKLVRSNEESAKLLRLNVTDGKEFYVFLEELKERERNEKHRMGSNQT